MCVTTFRTLICLFNVELFFTRARRSIPNCGATVTCNSRSIISWCKRLTVGPYVGLSDYWYVCGVRESELLGKVPGQELETEALRRIQLKSSGEDVLCHHSLPVILIGIDQAPLPVQERSRFEARHQGGWEVLSA